MSKLSTRRQTSRVAEQVDLVGRLNSVWPDGLLSQRNKENNKLDIQVFESFMARIQHELRRLQDLADEQFKEKNDFGNFLDACLDAPLVLIGAGKMGSALLKGWLRLGIKSKHIIVVDPKPSKQIVDTTEHLGILRLDDARKIEVASVLFLAIKPQLATPSLPFLRPLLRENTLVVSIMAGKTTHTISRLLQKDNLPIVRAMPNLPAAVGRGITAALKNYAVTDIQQGIAHIFLRATGAVEWIDDEDFMDAVTAVSGSGPAYVFLLAESLARAGMAAGLPEQLSEHLARETVVGSGELLFQSSHNATTLREDVTSPGGTTEAALEILMRQDGLDRLLQQAVAAATKRSRELSE